MERTTESEKSEIRTYESPFSWKRGDLLFRFGSLTRDYTYKLYTTWKNEKMRLFLATDFFPFFLIKNNLPLSDAILFEKGVIAVGNT